MQRDEAENVAAAELRRHADARLEAVPRLEAPARPADDAPRLVRELHLHQESCELTARLVALLNTPGDFRRHLSDLTAALQA